VKKTLVLTTIFILAGGITLSSIMVSAQEDYNIPAWIKNNAAWWSEGQIDDASFVSGITYMIENGIMEISQSNTSVNDMSLDDLYQENQEFREYFDAQIYDIAEYAGNEQVLSERILSLEAQLQAAQGNTPVNNMSLDYLYQENQEFREFYENTLNDMTDLKNEINSLKKQLSNASQNTSADATTIEVLANTNPFIRSILDGKINFYVEPLPYYAADGVAESVKELTDWMDSTPTWNQVYNENSADLHIGWVRDYGHKALGITYSKNAIEVGLGTQNCMGDWAPFNNNTIFNVLWHEIGHSMGYGHSDDPNNIMYYASVQQFYPDIDDSYYLGDGIMATVPFCGSGSYQYTVEVVEGDEYTGFDVDVLPPEQDPTKFVNEGGLHYPDCSPDGQFTSVSKECTVGGDGVNNFSKLIIFNDPYSGTPGEAIRINVTIIDFNPHAKPDLEWDSDAFQYDDEFLDLVSKFAK